MTVKKQLVDKEYGELNESKISFENNGRKVVMPKLEAMLLIEEFVNAVVGGEMKEEYDEDCKKLKQYARIVEDSNLLTEDEKEELVNKNQEHYGRAEALGELSNSLTDVSLGFIRGLEVESE